MASQTTFPHEARTAAEIYEETFVPTISEPVSRRLIELAALEPGERLLDLACGTGQLARAAAPAIGPTGEVVGVDISSEMIALARSAWSPDDVAGTWHEADATALPLEDDAFDCVCCQIGLMFVGDKPAALDEVRRVLRPGGRFVLSTPGPIQPIFEILDRALVEHVNPDLGGFVRAIFSLADPEAVRAMLDSAGFEDVEVEARAVTVAAGDPERFLWDYLGSTPIGGFVADAPEEVQRALHDDVVDQWRHLADSDGELAYDQPMVYARAASP